MIVICIVAAVVAVVAGVLAGYVDPGFWGVTSESSRILYTGGLGLLAGFAGLIACFSGLAVAYQRITGGDGRAGRLGVVVVSVLGVVLLLFLALRFMPR